jgi:hypothetical protein
MSRAELIHVRDRSNFEVETPRQGALTWLLLKMEFGFDLRRFLFARAAARGTSRTHFPHNAELGTAPPGGVGVTQTDKSEFINARPSRVFMR